MRYQFRLYYLFILFLFYFIFSHERVCDFFSSLFASQLLVFELFIDMIIVFFIGRSFRLFSFL